MHRLSFPVILRAWAQSHLYRSQTLLMERVVSEITTAPIIGLTRMQRCGHTDWSALRHHLHFRVNDLLKAVFFFVVGLEIEREVLLGNWRPCSRHRCRLSRQCKRLSTRADPGRPGEAFR
jgi:hypothetical protein